MFTLTQLLICRPASAARGRYARLRPQPARPSAVRGALRCPGGGGGARAGREDWGGPPPPPRDEKEAAAAAARSSVCLRAGASEGPRLSSAERPGGPEAPPCPQWGTARL